MLHACLRCDQPPKQTRFNHKTPECPWQAFSRGRPQCLSCMRRVLNGFNTETWLSWTRPQVRGKKKLAKSVTIKVRLLADIPQYGRKGRIIPISPGRMRNDFYPNKMADYMTVAQLRETGIQESTMERDPTFGSHQDRIAAGKPKRIDNPDVVPAVVPPAVEVDLIKPEQAMKILAELLPENVDFYRSSIVTAPAAPQRHSPSVPIASAISAAAQEAARPQTPKKTSIYGSVSTSDVAENLKAILAEDDKGSRVVLTSEDIVFVTQGEEKDRVKHLGNFEIDVKVKGAAAAIRRIITVKTQG